MLERRHSSSQSIGLELAALRIEHDLQSALIVRMADALYMPADQRDMVAALQALHTEVAVWAASIRPVPSSTCSAGPLPFSERSGRRSGVAQSGRPSHPPLPAVRGDDLGAAG